MFKPGDLVTFIDNLTLFDGNKCLVTFKGDLVKDPFDKPGRQWVVMALVPKGVHENTDELYLLCPIAPEPKEYHGEPNFDLPDGTLGLIEHDTMFQRGAATVAPLKSLRVWLIGSKGTANKLGKGVHNIATQPEWTEMDRAFWKLWATAVQHPVGCWNKLSSECKKPKAAMKVPKRP